LVGRLEIGAAVLPVGIEEQRKELPVEIVMVGDVTPCALAAMEIAQQPLCPHPERRFTADALVEHDGEG
jgi:hypothetical protein